MLTRLAFLCALFIVLFPTSVYAQDTAWFEKEITATTKLLASVQLRDGNCAGLRGREVECHVITQKMLSSATDRLKCLYKGRQAVLEKNKEKIWEHMICFRQQVLMWEEVMKLDWDKNPFGIKWDIRVNGARSMLPEWHRTVQKTYSGMQKNFCTVLEGPAQAECSVVFNSLVKAEQNVIEWAERVNQVYDSGGTKEQYFEATIGQARAVVHLTELEAIAHQQFLP